LPQSLFRVHNWRTDVETLGEVPAEFIHEQSKGKLKLSWPAQVNRLISRGLRSNSLHRPGRAARSYRHGNYTKNILVGTGGREGINRSHYLGAVYGMERIMGRAENPVRSVLNYASDHFLQPSSHCLRAHRCWRRAPTAALPSAVSSSATTPSAFIWPPN
jgi:hypothetical protein